MAELVHYRAERGVATLTLDSPHNANALSAQLTAELLAGLRRAWADESVRVGVLTHAGRVFCSGADLTESRRAGGATPLAALPVILQEIWESPKPVLARVGGPVRAGGLGLVGACDIALAAQDATFGFTEVRLGVIPAVISATVLPRMLARAAQELFLTGETFDGRRAAAVGLVNAAVPADQLDAAVDRCVGMLLRGAPGALAGAKQLLRRAPRPAIADDLAALAELSARYFAGDEGREGLRAYAEKRDPAWVPRD